MITLDHLPGRAFRQDGAEWLYFSGTAYLGIPHLPVFQEALLEGFQKYGTNFGGSRSSNLQLRVFEEAEVQLAEWVGLEAALTLSSGSMACQALLNYLSGEWPGLFYMAPNVHPALQSEGAIWSRSTDFRVWTEEIINMDVANYPDPITLFLSSVDPLFCKEIPFGWLKSLPSHRKYRLVIDDSHGLGLFGPLGQGVKALLPNEANLEHVIVGSLGKALGLPGGVIIGSKKLIEGVKRSSFFSGASPMVPAYLYSWMKTRQLVEEQREQLASNIHFLEEHWPEEIPVHHQPGYPVFGLLIDGLGTKLFEKRILISSFSYPDPHDQIIERIVVNSLHTRGDLGQLIAAMEEGCRN